MNSGQKKQSVSSKDLLYIKSLFCDFDENLIISWDESELSNIDHQDAIIFSSYTHINNYEQMNRKNRYLSDFASIGELFKDYVTQVQLGSLTDVQNSNLTDYFLKYGGLIELILQQPCYDRKLSNYIVKLHDIISNAIPGNIEVEFLKPPNIARRVLSSLLFCHLIICIKDIKTDKAEDDTEDSYKFFAPTLSSAIKNYTYYEDVVMDYVNALYKLCKNTQQNKTGYIMNSKLIQNFNAFEKETFFRSVLSFSKDSVMVQGILNPLTVESKEVLFKLVLSRSSFRGIDIYRRSICALSRLSFEKKNNIAHMLIKVMNAWADPIIAKAHVTAEIIHYTHLVFSLFYHLASSKTILLSYQQQIVEQIAKGLPNHLNSTDFRTISLAKMICELMTESLKFYSGNSSDAKLDEKFLLSLAENDLCKEVLMGYTKDCCEDASHFWMKNYSISNVSSQTLASSNTPEMLEKSNDILIDSDDDDDDLQPIESMDVPDHDQKTKIVYIRDFLEKLPEIKTYDETATVLKTLPNVIKHQLLCDHEQVGKDILDAIFRWENDFDQPILDEYRKTNLCTILETKTEGNVDHFCKYFHGISQLQPYKKNLILDVLTTVSKTISLKQLDVLAHSAFNHILYDENSIKNQDVTVKIPLILFFSNILSNTLPRVMVKEQMVISYLKCLTQIENDSASTEQAAMYAIHNLVGSLEGFQFSETVQASISDTRTWLCRLKNMEINHL